MKAWGMTHPGIVRETNEDAYAIWVSDDGRRGFFAVCDGMGGAQAGEIASKLAIDAFCAEMEPLKAGAFTLKKAQEQIQKAADSANRSIYMSALEIPERAGMGTTMVSMTCNAFSVAVGNIGDSRAYLADENGLNQLTEDHSLVHEMIRRGELTPEQAVRHPSRNVITRALGVDDKVPCDLFALETKPGDMLLLCSDGLTGEVSGPEIYYEIYQRGEPETACAHLIELAKNRGGHDNITVVLVVF